MYRQMLSRRLTLMTMKFDALSGRARYWNKVPTSTPVGQGTKEGEAVATVLAKAEKQLLWQTQAGGVIVVTADLGRGFETRVLGGDLDGWVVAAQTRAQAGYNHKWVAQLVSDNESPSGLRRREEAEAN
jgi:hypothetical protein